MRTPSSTQHPALIHKTDLVHMTTYGEWLHRRGLSESTIQARLRFYESRAFGEWAAWPPTLDQMLAYLSRYSGWTRLTYHTNLISVFDWMVEAGMVESNTARLIRRSTKPSPRPRPLSELDLGRALSASDGRTRSFLMLGYLAGLRAHEIAKVHGRDIDETHLRVIGKGATDSRLPTHPLLWELAQFYPRGDWWFPSPYGGHVSACTVTTSVRRLFGSLGIAGATHRTRHTYATTMLRGGANLRVVQDLLRHRSLATTALYLGVDEDERQAAIRSLAA